MAGDESIVYNPPRTLATYFFKRHSSRNCDGVSRGRLKFKRPAISRRYSRSSLRRVKTLKGDADVPYMGLKLFKRSRAYSHNSCVISFDGPAIGRIPIFDCMGGYGRTS